MGLTKDEVENLVSIAKEHLGKRWTIKGKEYTFSKINNAEGSAEEGKPITYKVTGELTLPDKSTITKSLKDIVEHFKKEA